MVVFTCAHCGDSIQKPKVEKHYDTKCRNNFPDLCCVDCLKDFRGDEFKAHTKCISEAERYGGKGFVAKENKGERKQNEWIEIVQSVLDDNKKMSGSLKSLLERVAQQPNTPRKRAKFINFVTSMDRRTNPKDIEGAWDLLSAKLDLLKKNNEHQRKENGKSESTPVSSDNKTNDDKEMETENGLDNNKEKKNKKKSRKHDDSSTENNENSKLDITTDSVYENVEKKTKKSKKQKTIDGEMSQVNGENDVTINEDVSPLTENGVKRNKKNKMETDNDVVQEDTTAATEEKTLTKKEKKEKKKRERYEAQLKEIESAKPELSESIVEEVAEEKKKSKKRKLDQNIQSSTVENGTVLKEKSLPQENGIKEEPAEKKLKNDGPTEFHWTDAILSVIGNKGKDISLKKLQKRVLTEYCVTHNITELNDRINKKFTKTLNRISNVRIENDKVRIVEDE